MTNMFLESEIRLEMAEVDAVVMGSSWKFSARASPSYADSGSSEPELGQFNFRAEIELKFF